MLIRTRLPLKNSKCSNEGVDQAAVMGSCPGFVWNIGFAFLNKVLHYLSLS